MRTLLILLVLLVLAAGCAVVPATPYDAYGPYYGPITPDQFTHTDTTDPGTITTVSMGDTISPEEVGITTARTGKIEGEERPSLPFAAPAKSRGLMLLGHLSHGLPIVVAPALIDPIVMPFGNAALPEREPSASFYFFKGEYHLGKMILRPVAASP